MSYKDPRMARIETIAMEWLTRLNRDDLTDEQQQQFFQWLEASPLHQAAYINAEDLWLRGEVLAKVGKADTSSWVGMRWGWAFAVSSLFVIGIWLILPRHVELQEYSSSFGEQKTVVLEDGSRLTLNSDTTVSIRLEGSARVAELHRGETFFEVAPDSKRPFSVITAQGLVRVIGTSFSVRQLAEDTLVTVLEGKVALGEIVSSTENFKENQMLTANQHLSLKEAHAGEAPKTVEARDLLAWRDRQLIFKGRPLMDVAHELERYFHVKISFSNSELGQRKITAVLQLSDQKATLDQLALALGLSWESGEKPNEIRFIAPTQ